MDFGTVLKNECVNVPQPPDLRCQDPAFAFANPTVCPVVPKLILKPGSSLVCLLGSLQFRAFFVSNGQETDVTDSTLFTVSDPTVCVIGAKSGNATGIAGGDVTVSAVYQNLTAAADLTVIAKTASCCSSETAAFMVMVDNSKSMSQAFGGIYPTKFAFAKKAAQQFITEINGLKDLVGLMTFNGFEEPIIDAPTHNKTAVASHVATLALTAQSTTFFDPITAAVNALTAVTADKKVIVIISDGQDETTSDYATKNPVSAVETFKLAGGLVICLGVRSTGTGYLLLNALCTGGFFANSYPGIESEALRIFSGIKGYVCAGNCVPEGDVFAATGQLNYDAWTHWTGQADLLGNGFVDLLPGNGLYVDLSSAAAPHGALLTSKVTYHVTAGKNYRLTMFLAGNQRVDLPSNVTVNITGASFTYLNQTVSISDYTAGFDQHAFTFSPQTDDDVTIKISGAGSSQLTIAGPLLDRIVFENTTDLVMILNDDFDSENVQYIPPRCGPGSTPLYGGAGGGGSGGIFTSPNLILQGSDPTSISATANSVGAKLAVWFCCADTGPITVSDSLNNVWTARPQRNATNRVAQMFYCVLPNTDVLQVFTANGANICAWLWIFDCPGTPGFIADTFNAADNFTTIQPGALSPSGSQLFITGVALDFASGNVNVFPDPDYIDASWWGMGTNAGMSAFIVSDTVQNPTWTITSGPSDGEALLATFGTDIAAGYGFATGYACYGVGCLNSDPAPAQLQDPNALPDIEAGFIPPTMYSSTKTACVTCPAGFVNIPPASELLTSADSATATASNSVSPLTAITPWEANQALPQWLRYQFATPTVVTAYSIENVVGDIYQNNPIQAPSPADFVFQGSNDGSTWVTLDTQTGVAWPSVQITKQFLTNNVVAYTYYRLLVSAADQAPFIFGGSVGSIYIQVAQVQLFGALPGQACATATETSTVSQADADTKAMTTASNNATALLNCQRLYTSTQNFTAHCPAGTLGAIVTRSASATSFISQDDADTKALALAEAAANAALSCDSDNHNQGIVITDAAPATPYPSVKRVTGLTGHITKVTVTVKNFSHASPSDVQMVLQSPQGTLVQLMLRCGGPLGANPVSNLTFVFDDAGSAMPENSALTGGTFAPTQFGLTPNLPAPAALPPYQAALASLIGEDPNGSWALWVVDILAISAGTIAGVPAFDVTITSA